MTFRPRFLALQPGFGHFHGSTWPGPIQVASTLVDHFSVITSKQSRTQSKLSQSLYALKEICCLSAWLIGSRNRALLWFLSTAPGIPKRAPHPSTILAQCCLTLVFLRELVFPTWQGLLTAAKIFNFRVVIAMPNIFCVRWRFRRRGSASVGFT